MAYKNKNGQPRERAMVAAYSLVTQFGGKQQDVAKVLDCSPSTIHQWVKEISYRKEIDGLKQELSDANEYIEELADNLGLEYHPDEQDEDEYEQDEDEYEQDEDEDEL